MNASTKVLHLHGELLKVRSTVNLITYRLGEDLHSGDFDENIKISYVHIVWFGEVPALELAIEVTDYC
jgi:NAD-dependent deacetylase